MTLRGWLSALMATGLLGGSTVRADTVQGNSGSEAVKAYRSMSPEEATEKAQNCLFVARNQEEMLVARWANLNNFVLLAVRSGRSMTSFERAPGEIEILKKEIVSSIALGRLDLAINQSLSVEFRAASLISFDSILKENKMHPKDVSGITPEQMASLATARGDLQVRDPHAAPAAPTTSSAPQTNHRRL